MPTHPLDFSLLATIVTFRYINDERHLHHARPTITLEPSAPSDGGSNGKEPRVTAVSYYRPPFQALLPRDTFYDALGRFAALVEAHASAHAHQLTEGDAVVFDNRQILHGRTTLEDRLANEADGEQNRWLEGCFFEGDAMASHGRVLRARMARGEI